MHVSWFNDNRIFVCEPVCRADLHVKTKQANAVKCGEINRNMTTIGAKRVKMNQAANGNDMTAGQTK